MEPVKPTPIKFEPEFKKAIQEFADKKERGNISAVVKKATEKYIKYKKVK
jgi:predicted transcriptional regulator